MVKVFQMTDKEIIIIIVINMLYSVISSSSLNDSNPGD